MTTFSSIEALNAHLKTFAQQARKAIDQGQYLEAQHAIEQVLALVPQHTVALTDLAFVKTRQNKPFEAYAHLIEALKYSGDKVEPNLYDTLVAVCIELKRFEEAIYFAKISIQTKKQQHNDVPLFALPNHPTPTLSANPKQNIISYSLFGKSPRYCEVAVLNVDLAKQIYPNWTCRFYINHSVPSQIVQRLQQKGAEIVYVDEKWQQFSGLFWRFAVIDDPNVRAFMIRDADSLLSYKEQAAVQAWLDSGKWFHLMRDGMNHSELILAGMWGGYTGVLHNMYNIIAQLLTEVTNHTSTIDQIFLRQRIFPSVIQSALVHDSFHLDKNTQPFPDYNLSDIERIPHFHIGMVDAGARAISLTITEHAVQKVRWWLLDKQNQEICSYESDVPPSRIISLNLPYFYAEKVERGEYHFAHAPVLTHNENL